MRLQKPNALPRSGVEQAVPLPPLTPDPGSAVTCLHSLRLYRRDTGETMSGISAAVSVRVSSGWCADSLPQPAMLVSGKDSATGDGRFCSKLA